MKKLRLQLEASGLARFSPAQALTVVIAGACLAASWVQLSFEVLGLTFFSALAVLGLSFEALRLRARQRSEELAKLWPEVLDAMHSAATSGYGLLDALQEIARSGPLRLRQVFQQLVDRLDTGSELNRELDWFKSQFGLSEADRFAELIRVVHKLGGVGYLDSLRDQALRARSEIALWGELESKQGWVTGTAKLAIIAPWIIVSILAVRPENTAIYNTAEGFTILMVGLAVSLFAYRLVALMGAISKPGRVLTR